MAKRPAYRPARRPNTNNRNAGPANPLKAILANNWEAFAESVQMANGQELMLQVGAPTVAAYEAAHRYPSGSVDQLAILLESGLPEYQQHYVEMPEVQAVLKRPAFIAKIKAAVDTIERLLAQANY